MKSAFKIPSNPIQSRALGHRQSSEGDRAGQCRSAIGDGARTRTWPLGFKAVAHSPPSWTKQAGLPRTASSKQWARGSSLPPGQRLELRPELRLLCSEAFCDFGTEEPEQALRALTSTCSGRAIGRGCGMATAHRWPRSCCTHHICLLEPQQVALSRPCRRVQDPVIELSFSVELFIRIWPHAHTPLRTPGFFLFI